METESCVPPGFRFHPTEEELVGYYLKRKINSLKIDLDVIVDIDLYRMEPWDIQDRCRLGYEEQNEWYFFSHKDKKYPTGTRTNRATAAGFWKATGRDKAVISKDRIIGMRKTLVFYKGRAPNGWKTDWIMHEYRLQASQYAPPQEEGWVVCRAFKKPSPNQNHAYPVRNNYPIANFKHAQPSCLDIGVSNPMVYHYPDAGHAMPFPQQTLHEFDSEGDVFSNQLPQLDSPSLSASMATKVGGEHASMIINLDDLLAAQLDEPASFSHSNQQLLSQEFEIDAQNHPSHLFTCFPEL
ncbi:hypothetical protein NMG60_11017509 [Bertholletia excelsa]